MDEKQPPSPNQESYPEASQDQASYMGENNFLVEFGTRLNEIEEKLRIIRDRVLLIGENLISTKEDFEKESLQVKDQISKIDFNIKSLDRLNKRITNELGNFSRKAELKILERQMKMFQPLEFAKIQDVKDIIQKFMDDFANQEKKETTKIKEVREFIECFMEEIKKEKKEEIEKIKKTRESIEKFMENLKKEEQINLIKTKAKLEEEKERERENIKKVKDELKLEKKKLQTKKKILQKTEKNVKKIEEKSRKTKEKTKKKETKKKELKSELKEKNTKDSLEKLSKSLSEKAYKKAVEIHKKE